MRTRCPPSASNAPREPAVIFEHGVEARLAQRLHEARRALDVGEDEGEGARGQGRVAAGAHCATASGAGRRHRGAEAIALRIRAARAAAAGCRDQERARRHPGLADPLSARQIAPARLPDAGAELREQRIDRQDRRALRGRDVVVDHPLPDRRRTPLAKLLTR
jgi:hypothetical protein